MYVVLDKIPKTRKWQDGAQESAGTVSQSSITAMTSFRDRLVSILYSDVQRLKVVSHVRVFLCLLDVYM